MGDHPQNNPKHNHDTSAENLTPHSILPDSILPDSILSPTVSLPGLLPSVTPSAMPEDLATIADLVNSAATNRRGDPLLLLALLRLLESLHRDIRDGYFQEALPDNRQALYALLKDIESEGGWPYIYRRRLEDFARALAQGAIGEGDGDRASSGS